MNVVAMSIEALIPYEFNNRVHNEEQVNRIANSIKEFGFNQPIVIDESNIILVGHGRLAAAQKLGLKSVPVLQVKDLTETQKKAYRILDNKLQNDSAWDFNNLELELGFLEDNGFELEPWGLDDLTFKPDLVDAPELADGDGSGFKNMTFTVTEEQGAVIDDALRRAKDLGDFVDTGNENSNGNALARICEMFRDG